MLNAGGSSGSDSPGFNLGFEVRPHQIRKLATTPEPVARFVRTRTMRAAGSGVVASVPQAKCNPERTIGQTGSHLLRQPAASEVDRRATALDGLQAIETFIEAFIETVICSR